MFSLRGSTVGAFAVPFRVLSQKKWQEIKPRPQHSTLVPLRGSFQKLWSAPLPFLWEFPSPGSRSEYYKTGLLIFYTLVKPKISSKSIKSVQNRMLSGEICSENWHKTDSFFQIIFQQNLPKTFCEFHRSRPFFSANLILKNPQNLNFFHNLSKALYKRTGWACEEQGTFKWSWTFNKFLSK